MDEDAGLFEELAENGAEQTVDERGTQVEAVGAGNVLGVVGFVDFLRPTFDGNGEINAGEAAAGKGVPAAHEAQHVGAPHPEDLESAAGGPTP